MCGDATARGGLGLVASLALALSGCVCAAPGLGPDGSPDGRSGPPAALVPRARGALPRASLAIVRGDTGEVTDRVARATERALLRGRCLPVVSQRALLNRWPGYPRDVPLPARGKYHATVDIGRPLPKVARIVAAAAGAGYVALVWAGGLRATRYSNSLTTYFDQTIYVQVYGADGTLVADAVETVDAQRSVAPCVGLPGTGAAPELDAALARYGRRLAVELRGVFAGRCTAGSAPAAVR